MSAVEQNSAPRHLIDAVSRDVVILGVSIWVFGLLADWHTASPGWVSLGVGWAVSFVLGFLLMYLSHEWGHYLGARLSGANIPLGTARGLFLGLLDPDTWSRRQFLWMGWGGDVGYLIPAPIVIWLFWDAGPLQGLAAAAAAFIVQSLYVDVPVLTKIGRGADIKQTLATGTAPNVILRKTLISWAVLAAGVTGLAAAL